MKTLIVAATLGVLACVPSAFAETSGALDPTGTWMVEDGRAKIHIAKCSDDAAKVCGRVAWMRDPLDDKGHPRTDINNPDPSKRSQPALGMLIVDHLKPDDDEFYTGQIYNAENGKMYDVHLKMESAEKLRVKGCVLSVLCMSQHWSRVADMPATVVAQSQKPGKARPQPAAPSE